MIYLLSACMIAAWVLAVIDLASTDWDYEPEEYRHSYRQLQLLRQEEWDRIFPDEDD